MSSPSLQTALQHLATTAVNGVNDVDFPFSQSTQQVGAAPATQAVSVAATAQAPSAQLPSAPSQSTPSWQAQSEGPQPQPQSNDHPSAQLSLPSGNDQSRSPALSTTNPSVASTTATVAAPSTLIPFQGVQQTALPTLHSFGTPAAQDDGYVGKKRGRPRKYFDDESKRAADIARRKRAKNGNDTEGDSESGTAGTGMGPGKKEERRPYLHYQMDYGRYDSSKPDALTARDIVVNWLATGTNFQDWLLWPMEKKNEVANELREELKSHGMLDRDTVSVKQQITFLQRGCEEAKNFEKDKMDQPLTPFNSTKVSYLVNRGLTPGQAYIEHTWPFYSKLKDVVANVSVPMPISRPPRPPKPDPPRVATRFNPQRSSQMLGSYNNNNHGDYDAIDDALDPALTGIPLPEPSQSEVLAVTSWANQLLSQESQRRQTGGKPSHLSRMDDAEAVRILREKEKWELEKLQIRQKLELEKEQMKSNDKNAERETHIQSILVFRDLLKDGFKRSEAGRIVWRDAWDSIKEKMDADD